MLSSVNVVVVKPDCRLLRRRLVPYHIDAGRHVDVYASNASGTHRGRIAQKGRVGFCSYQGLIPRHLRIQIWWLRDIT